VTKRFRQPRVALKPSAFSVEAAEKWALKRTSKLPAGLFRLTALWYVDFVRQPTPDERKTRYTARIAQSENYGFSTGPTPVTKRPDPALVGQDARQILSKRAYRDSVERTALVDLIIDHGSRAADRRITLDRPSRVIISTRAERRFSRRRPMPSFDARVHDITKDRRRTFWSSVRPRASSRR
jgi:hypothetical protein